MSDTKIEKLTDSELKERLKEVNPVDYSDLIVCLENCLNLLDKLDIPDRLIEWYTNTRLNSEFIITKYKFQKQ